MAYTLGVLPGLLCDKLSLIKIKLLNRIEKHIGEGWQGLWQFPFCN